MVIEYYNISMTQPNAPKLIMNRRPERFVNSIFNKREKQEEPHIYPYQPKYNGISRIRTRDEVWDGYRRFRKGDIVRIADSGDGKHYFGQISELTVDKYAQRFAFIVWLIPKSGASVPNIRQFDPNNFEHSIAEQRPVSLIACEFECHCPPFPPYSIDWTPDSWIRKKLRDELCHQLDASNSFE